jgi:hypothetical protein
MTKLEVAQGELKRAQEALNTASEQYRRAIILFLDALGEDTLDLPEGTANKDVWRDLVRQRQVMAEVLSSLANSRYCLAVVNESDTLPDTPSNMVDEERIALINSLPDRYGRYHSSVSEFLRQKREDAERENEVRGDLRQ